MLLSGTAFAQQFGFRLIEPSPGYRRVEPGGLSANGLVVGGWSTNQVVPGPVRDAGLLESADGSRVDFSILNPQYPSGAIRSVSGNGAMGVGSVGISVARSATPSLFHASTGLIEELGFIAGYSKGEAWGADEAGQTVIGTFTREIQPLFPERAAFRWTSDGGMRQLMGADPFDEEVSANDVSRNGRVTVGISSDSDSFTAEAVKWIDDGPAIRLPFLNGLQVGIAGAHGVSGNGDWVVGYSSISSSGGAYPVVWDPDGGVTLLTGPLLGGGIAWDVSDDGQTIVGGGGTAFIWTPLTQRMRLSDYLQSVDISLPPNIVLEDAFSVSGDGHTIAGRAIVDGLRQTFVVTVPSPAAITSLALLCCFRSRRRSP